MPPPSRPPKGAAKPWLKGQADDLASLANLDETILLEELRVRYDGDKIYTYVGDILVAVNPFRRLPIYTQEFERKYHDTVKSAAPPHIFAIADQAYHSMVRNQQDQCAIISGESGAGKTESAKYMIGQIIRLCHQGNEGNTLEERIIQVNPLLEAFGNAATLMNHNSSRFGKYTELKFSPRGAVVGAQISEYLLEKSRVVRQKAGERNFHVFYYLFADPQRSSLFLGNVGDYSYVRGGKPTSDNSEMFQELVKSLDIVGFSPNDQREIKSLLAAILFLGNISYDAVYSDHDPAQMSSPPAMLANAAKLLEVPEATLKEALMVNITVTRGESIRRPYSVDKAIDCRDAFAKAIYGRMFGWIVAHINEMLSPEFTSRSASDQFLEIGILDIFGFEHFEHNGFEQMCINCANEQLQHFFNDHIFKWELQEYEREGIDANKISFVDNQPVLDMFLGKPLGLFGLLDEESHFPKSTEKSLVAKFKANLKCEAYVPVRTDDASFTVQHYAGPVEYGAQGFLENNRDSLAADVVTLAQTSGNSICSAIFLGEITSTGNVKAGSRGAKKNTVSRKSPTVGAQFTNSLKILMEKMRKCMAHFVRCIKPNTTQSPKNFVGDFVNAQLRYTGMLETTRIRREGFSFRPTFEEFMERFGLLAYGTRRPAASSGTCSKVMDVSGLKGWLMGRTKVFLKYWHVEQLDKQQRIYNEKAITMQAVCRGYLARRERRRMKLMIREQAKQSMLFFDQMNRDSLHYADTMQGQDAADMRRFASGRILKPAAPPGPKKSEKELKRDASILWWREKEQPKGAGQDIHGNFLPWFHGIISRKEAERLLAPRTFGCFLVRVSENRFGYTLSYRIMDRCRHYMVEQDTQGRYALVGVDKVSPSLNKLVDFFRKNAINEERDMLRDPCGQEINDAGEEQCDYGELLAPGQRGYRQEIPETGPPPPVNRGRKPSTGVRPGAAAGGAAPPSVSRANKPGSFSAADAPPMVNRRAKPAF